MSARALVVVKEFQIKLSDAFNDAHIYVLYGMYLGENNDENLKYC